MNNPVRAFPLHLSGSSRYNEGMDLRDYFAAKALQGMLSTAGAPCLSGLGGAELSTANFAYKMADAMMEARKKGY